MLRTVSVVLRRTLSWTFVAVLFSTICASAALFTLVDTVLLEPLPYRDPHELVIVSAPLDLAKRFTTQQLAAMADRIESSDLLSGFATVRQGTATELLGPSDDRSLVHYVVGSDFFEVLQAAPRAGRMLGRQDVATDAVLPVMISEALWVSRFGGDPEVLRRPSRLGAKQVQIVGVVPTRAVFPVDATIWSIGGRVAASELPDLVRLRPEASVKQLGTLLPGLKLQSIEDRIRPKHALGLWLILGTAVILVLLGGVQLVTIQLSRLTSRIREIAVRIALGATPQRLRLELGIESAVLLAITVPAAILLVAPTAALMARVVSDGFGEPVSAEVSWRGYGFVVFAALGAGIAVHLCSRTFIRRLMKARPSLRHMTDSALPFLGWRRVVLLGFQVGLTVSLLYATSLALVTYSTATRIPLGFDPDAVFAMPVRSGSANSPDRLQQRVRLETAVEHVRALPGVLSVTTTYRRPMEGGVLRGTARVSRLPEFAPRTVLVNYVGSDYFRTLGIPIQQGTGLMPHRRGIVVNATLARQLDAVGAGLGDMLQVTSHREPIVGIAADVAQNLSGETWPEVYLPDVIGMAQTVVVRTDGLPGTLLLVRDALRVSVNAVHEIDAVSLRADWERLISPRRTQFYLLGLITTASCFVVLFGVSGSMSSVVQAKRKELAVRLALGGGASHTVRMLLRSIGWPILIGTGAGAAAGIGAARFTASLWHGAQWLDGNALMTAVCFMVLITATASWPALTRAVRTTPMAMLRED